MANRLCAGCKRPLVVRVEYSDKNARTERVRLLSLSGNWFDELPIDEKSDVLSMIGEVFEIEEIDSYGHPLVSKSWPDDKGKCHSHSIALERHEMELVLEQTL